jgi:hypothetical protein
MCVVILLRVYSVGTFSFRYSDGFVFIRTARLLTCVYVWSKSGCVWKCLVRVCMQATVGNLLVYFISVSSLTR